MIKLFKYLRPLKIPIMIAIILLSIEAAAELNLPEYMGDIVTKGIQQGGIENYTPILITKDTLDDILLSTLQENKDTILQSYVPFTPSNLGIKKYNEYKNNYPIRSNKSIYVLKPGLKSKQKKNLDHLLGKSFLILSDIKKSSNSKILFNNISVNNAKITLTNMRKLDSASRNNLIKKALLTGSRIEREQLSSIVIPEIKNEYLSIGMDLEKLQKDYLFRIGIMMAVWSVASAISLTYVIYIASKTSCKITEAIRKDIFAKVQTFSKTEYDKFTASSLITRTTSDVFNVQWLSFYAIDTFFYVPIIIVGGFLKTMDNSMSMSIMILIVVLILSVLIVIVMSIVSSKYDLVQTLIDKINLAIRENLSGIFVVRAFNAQNIQEDRFDECNRRLASSNLFIDKVNSLVHPIVSLSTSVTTVLIVWMGAGYIAQSKLQVGEMLSFIGYAMLIIYAFFLITMVIVYFPKAAVSAKRIAEILDCNPVVSDPSNSEDISPVTKNTLEFRNVSFRYPNADKDILSNISFSANSGEVVAFIGSTGSGKSTLVNLIPRFYDVTSGEILIGDVNIKNIYLNELRSKISYTPQKGVLFKGTIESNLRYGNIEASQEKLLEAAQIAQIDDFIMNKPEQIGFEISQGGTNVSGGQRQRLSIARSIVKDPDIYIFDDSFSALDAKTDFELRKALYAKIRKNSIVIIITQKVSTILNANKIIVLDQGKIVGTGTHNELTKKCPIYAEIVSSQLSSTIN